MWFKNLKVGKKLAVAFGAIVVMISILAGMTVTGNGRASQQVERLYQDGVLGTGNITNLYANAAEDRGLLLEMLSQLEHSGKVPDSLNTRMDALDVQRDEIWKAYNATVVDPVDKANWAELNTIFDEYKGASEEIEALMKEGNYKAGVVIANGKLASVFNEKLTPKFNEMVKWNIDTGSKYHSDTMGFLGQSKLITIATTVVCLLTALFFGFLVTKVIVRPLVELKKQLTSLGENCIAGLATSVEGLKNGDLCGEVIPVTSPLQYAGKDEIGEICNAFDVVLIRTQETVKSYNICLSDLRQVMSEIDDQATGVAASSQQLAASSASTAQLANQTGVTMSEVGHAVSETSSTSEQIAQGAQQLASEAQEAANAVEALTQAIDGVTAATKEQGSITKQASEIAAQGGEAVNRTIQSMTEIEGKVAACAGVIQDLGEKQAQIGNIVQTIDDIAAQTNLLALNAAIEAARAGEHGKGFAVVAEEVRKLAERCGNATQEISELIGSVSAGVNQSITAMEESMSKVQEGTAFSGEARSALEGIIGSVAQVQESATANAKLVQSMTKNAEVVQNTVAQVASISQETAAGAEELSASSEEMTASVEEVDRTVREQVELVGQMSAMSQELAATADNLKVMMSRFRYDKGAPALRVEDSGQKAA
ncbi:MAG: methyl-accepting chemotaxis protein [Fimbriimonadaceae bacterium]